MHKKISPQSKSFLVLFAIAVIGTYATLLIAQRMVSSNLYGNNVPWNSANSNGDVTYSYSQAAASGQNAAPTPATPAPAPVDTTNWKTFNNAKYNFSLKYPANWQVSNLGIKGGYYEIQINPGKKLGLMKIYINHLDFLGLDALPITQEAIAGETAQNVRGELYGIRHNSVYYTFDLGTALTLQPEFSAMVHTLSFQ